MLLSSLFVDICLTKNLVSESFNNLLYIDSLDIEYIISIVKPNNAFFVFDVLYNIIADHGRICFLLFSIRYLVDVFILYFFVARLHLTFIKIH